MSATDSSGAGPATYQIRAIGTIIADCTEELKGMTITVDVGPDGAHQTTLVGEISDQGALLAVVRLLHQQRLALMWLRRLDDSNHG